MAPRKLKNITLSLIISIIWASMLILWSSKVNSDSGVISVLYIGIKTTSLLTIFSAALLFALRLFRLLDPERNLFYSLVAVVNVLLGIGGVCSYLFHKINLIGLHDLLLNLLIGVILLTDILFFATILKNRKY